VDEVVRVNELGVQKMAKIKKHTIGGFIMMLKATSPTSDELIVDIENQPDPEIDNVQFGDVSFHGLKVGVMLVPEGYDDDYPPSWKMGAVIGFWDDEYVPVLVARNDYGAKERVVEVAVDFLRSLETLCRLPWDVGLVQCDPPMVSLLRSMWPAFEVLPEPCVDRSSGGA